MVTALGRVLRGPLVPSVFVAVILAGVTPGTSQGGGTVVPLDLSGRRAMVEVTVNGTGPHTFVVASTFTGVAIERSFAVELGLVEAAPDSESVWDHPAVDVTLDWIQLGDLNFGKVPAEAYGDEMQFLGRNPRGTLGLELFRDHLVTYDLAVGEFRLSQGALPEPNDDDVFAYEKHGVQDATEPELTPVIPATVAGKQMMIGLHTGFIGSLQLNSSLMDELPLSGVAGSSPASRHDSRARARGIGGRRAGNRPGKRPVAPDPG